MCHQSLLAACLEHYLSSLQKNKDWDFRCWVALDGEVLSHFSEVFPQSLYILNNKQLTLWCLHFPQPPPTLQPTASKNYSLTNARENTVDLSYSLIGLHIIYTALESMNEEPLAP